MAKAHQKGKMTTTTKKKTMKHKQKRCPKCGKFMK